jgi:hypothetical protein
MPLKGPLQKDSDTFTGFIVTYHNGSTIFEKLDYFSKKLNKKCATNWAEIDKGKISSIELLWKGDRKAIISKSPSDIHKYELNAGDWFFSHKGYLDMGTRKIVIISRNIGYIEDNILYIISVMENSGEVLRSIRAVPS